MAYSVVGDLLLGDGSWIIDPAFDKQKFIDSAADEMDGKLGVIYQIPLAAISPATVLPEYQVKLLKTINNNLASGRIFLTIDASGDGARQHAYGLQLVNQAMMDLMAIANGDVVLDAVRRDQTGTNESSRYAGISNRDTESAVEMFEEQVMRGKDAYWRPGDPATSQGGMVIYPPRYLPGSE